MHPNSTVRPTMRDLIDAPIGTTIQTGDGILLRKDVGGFWPANSYQPYGPSYLINNDQRVVEVGTQPDIESLAQFQQRLRTLAHGHAAVHSIRKEYIDAAMAALGIENDQTLRPGMWFHPYDADLAAVVPRGTLLVSGDPTVEGHHAVAEFNGYGNMDQLLGERRWESYTWGRVLRFPDDTEVEPWPTFDGTPEQERAAIHAFRRRIWEIGYRAKQDRDWCGQFEVMVGWVWVDNTVLDEPIEGDTEVTPEGTVEIEATRTRPSNYTQMRGPERVNALPVGAVTAYSDTGISQDSWNLMVRDDDSDYEERTYHLMGPNRGNWGTHAVVWDGSDADMQIRVCHGDHLVYAPVGTVIRTGSDRVKWTKTGDDTWVRDEATALPAEITSGRFAIDDTADPVFTHITGQPRVGGRVASKDSFDAAPDLTQVTSLGTGRVYIKTDGRWVVESNGRRADALRYDNMRWTAIPTQF